KGETTYSINLLPLGGFVKIYGETPEDVTGVDPDSARSFINKSKWIQVAVLLAGIVFNIIFAWLLLSATLTAGFPTAVDSYSTQDVSNIHLALVDISRGSPAEKAGLVPGDILTSIQNGKTDLTGTDLTVDTVENLITASNG